MNVNRTDSFKNLDDLLWVYHTAYKKLTGMSPYELVFGKSCHLPIELERKALCALKARNLDWKKTLKEQV